MTTNTTQPTESEQIWAILRELAEQSKETDRRFRETDRKFQDTDRKFQDTDRKFQASKDENDRQMANLRAELGKLGGRLGEFVQQMVRPAVVRLFQQRGIEVHEVHQNVFMKRDNVEAEFDLWVVNDGVAIAVECKSHCSVDDVKEHLDRLKKIKTLLPYYEKIQVMGAVAAMVMPDDVARYAYRKGLYVLAQSGETMLVKNDEKFKPKMW